MAQTYRFIAGPLDGQTKDLVNAPHVWSSIEATDAGFVEHIYTRGGLNWIDPQREDAFTYSTSTLI